MNKDKDTKQTVQEDDDDDLLGGAPAPEQHDDSMRDAVAHSMVSDVFPTAKPKVQSWPTYERDRVTPVSHTPWSGGASRYTNKQWKNPYSAPQSGFEDMQDDLPYDDEETPRFMRKGRGRRGASEYGDMTMDEATMRKNLGVALPITTDLITNYITQLKREKGQRQVEIYLKRLMQFVEDRYMEC
jgi:hypothetical protein